MNLIQALTEDMKESMRAGDAERTAVVRMLRGSLKNEEIKLGHALSEEEGLKVLQREAKQRRDAAAQYREADRPELAEGEERELAQIERYLPQPLSNEELDALISQVIAETGADSISQMGRVVGETMKRAGVRAEGARVSAAVRARLGS